MYLTERFKVMKKILIAATSIIILGACGGGSSSSVPDPSPIVSVGGGGSTGGGGSSGPALFENVLITKSYSGSSANNDTDSLLSISDDGSVIAFISQAENLTNDDNNGRADAFVYDGSSIKKLNYRYNGNQTYDSIRGAIVDRSGTYVYFVSNDPNMLSASQGAGSRTYRTLVTSPKENIIKFSDMVYSSSICLPTFSSDGKLFVGGSDIYEQIQDTRIVVVDTEISGTCPSISRNGQSVSYLESYGNGRNEKGIFKTFLTNNSDVRVDVEDSSWNNDGRPDIRPESISDISGDGRYIVFSSEDNRLTTEFGNDYRQIYIRDTLLRETILVTKNVSGGFAILDSINPSMSDDGNYIVFQSLSNGLTSQSVSGSQIYMYIKSSNSIRLLSGTSGSAKNPVISGDGSTVAYVSTASLDQSDSNGSYDIYKVRVR